MKLGVFVFCCYLVVLAVAVAAKAQLTTETRTAIRQVWGKDAWLGERIAWCESRYRVYATNGQYLGVFQMGDRERAKYGFAWNPWTQAAGAYAYFLDAGTSPWRSSQTCWE